MLSKTLLIALVFPIIATPHAITDASVIGICDYVSPPPVTTSLTHAQETWISALEWCESRGAPAAINKVDLDGTSSYYSFQFKPGTFTWFGYKYGVLKSPVLPLKQALELMKDTEMQRDIVRGMVKDPTTAWHIQFPDCVKKLGTPPTY